MTSTIEGAALYQGDKRAKLLVEARQNSTALPEYPGHMPTSLAEAYAIQDEGIKLIGKPIKGWKVGGINGNWREKYGETRLMGPIFADTVNLYDGKPVDMPVYKVGFAAVESEITAVIKKDVPSDIKSFTTEHAIEFVEALYIGIEIASSPFKEINDHGPLVTISDFGNNKGMILGPKIENWDKLDLAAWELETFINGSSVGKAAPVTAPGGPIESVRCALENTSKRGLPLKMGDIIVTGAVTGIHDVIIGDSSTLNFMGKEVLSCNITDSLGA